MQRLLRLRLNVPRDQPESNPVLMLRPVSLFPSGDGESSEAMRLETLQEQGSIDQTRKISNCHLAFDLTLEGRI